MFAQAGNVAVDVPARWSRRLRASRTSAIVAGSADGRSGRSSDLATAAPRPRRRATRDRRCPAGRPRARRAGAPAPAPAAPAPPAAAKAAADSLCRACRREAAVRRAVGHQLDRGEILWQVPHGDTPDNIRNHPALKGMNIPKTGQAGTSSVGLMVTKTLVVMGDPQVTAPPGRPRGAMLRAYDKQTGAQVGEVWMPAVAERIADDLHRRRQAVHHRRRQRRRLHRASTSRSRCRNTRSASSHLVIWLFGHWRPVHQMTK